MGMLPGSRGFDPNKTSSPSEKVSPSVSPLSGSVPNAISCALVSPSASGSALGSDPGIVSVLKLGVGRNPSRTVGSDEPLEFVALSVNRPLAPALTVTVIVAEVPLADIDTALTPTGAGTN